MRHSPSICCVAALFAILFLAGAAVADFGPIGDTLTVIQRPLLNIPSIIRPGDTLSINCDAPGTTTGWTASLNRGSITIPLTITASTYDASTEWWTLSAALPAVPLSELYDLTVTASGGISDVTWNAVKVIPEFREDYYFVHISDIHLPTHRYVDDPLSEFDSTEMQDLRFVMDDLSIINPEFVLATGDIINEGELEDYLGRRYYTRTQRLLAESDVPIYLISGNHDIGGWDSTPPSDGTARRDWWRFFGWGRLDSPPPGAPWYTQNYSFDYGPAHFTGLESYINYDDWRQGTYGNTSFTSGQMSWLASDLAAASGSTSQILFYHYDFDNQIDLNSLGVEMALWGHTHKNEGSLVTQPYDIGTDNVCDGARSYRLIRVSSGVVTPMYTRSAGDGTELLVDYSPANDGTNSDVTATIFNDTGEPFENGLLRFKMPAGGGNPVVTGGTLAQIDNSSAIPVYYVTVNILAGVAPQVVSLSLQPTGVEDQPTTFPRAVHLAQNQPNPFNPHTTLRFMLPEPGNARLEIFDTRGRRMETLVNEQRQAGEHTVVWDGTGSDGQAVPTGIYFARLVAGGEVRTRKIALAR